jgi:hypothetical protein
VKVTLETHGGLAAGLRLGGRPVVLDAAQLPEDDARTLGDLVAAARAEPAADPARRSAPDAMSYTVTVEDAGGPELLRRSDDGMTPAFAALLDWLGGRDPGA